jgi:hypothetical protein
MKTVLIALGLVVGVLVAGPASATIVFELGNHPQPDEQNILFTTPEIGLTLANGEVDHTGANVRFTTLGTPLQIITQKAEGQADIFCAANCVDNGGNQSSQLGSIRMSAGLSANGNPTAWQDAILNLDFGTGTALVTVTDNFGAPFSYVLGPGQNFLTMVASDNEFIKQIDVTNADPNAAFGFNSFKQPRVSGVCEFIGTSCAEIPPGVPAPMPLFLLGAGLLLVRKFGRA